MDSEIRKQIMGHWYRGKNVDEGYGWISDEELIEAIDGMTFDHGDTAIFVSTKKEKSRKRQPSGCDQIVTKIRSRQSTG